MLQTLFPLSRTFLKTHNQAYKRYLVAQSSLSRHHLSILLGQRGVGKTTALVQHLHATHADALTSEKCLYVPVDHFLVGETSLFEIAEEFRNMGGETLCLDEIHKYPNWSAELKSICDSFPRLNTIASGSAALVIRKGSHDLSRRALVVTMLGMSLREYIELSLGISLASHPLNDILRNHEKMSEVIMDAVEKRGERILPLFRRYIAAGYYPFAMETRDTALFHVLVEQGIHATIENDLLAVHENLTGSSIRKIRKLLSILAASVPFTPDLNKLKVALNIGDERTLKVYLEYLHEAGVLRLLPKAGGKIRSLAKPEKVYLNNTNQAYALLGSQDSANMGTIRETFLAAMVSAQHAVSVPRDGDFLIDNEITVEVGGKSKDFRQINNSGRSYLAVDDIERGSGARVPLWLFGFLY